MIGSNDKEMVEMNNKFGDIGLGVFNLGNLQPGEILTSLQAHPRLEPVFAALGADSHH